MPAGMCPKPGIVRTSSQDDLVELLGGISTVDIVVQARRSVDLLEAHAHVLLGRTQAVPAEVLDPAVGLKSGGAIREDELHRGLGFRLGD